MTKRQYTAGTYTQMTNSPAHSIPSHVYRRSLKYNWVVNSHSSNKMKTYQPYDSHFREAIRSYARTALGNNLNHQASLQELTAEMLLQFLAGVLGFPEYSKRLRTEINIKLKKDVIKPLKGFQKILRLSSC